MPGTQEDRMALPVSAWYFELVRTLSEADGLLVSGRTIYHAAGGPWVTGMPETTARVAFWRDPPDGV
jgi:hypothetical protein